MYRYFQVSLRILRKKNDSIYRLYFEFSKKLLRSLWLCELLFFLISYKNAWYWKKIAFLKAKRMHCVIYGCGVWLQIMHHSDLFCIATKALAIRWNSRFQFVKLVVISYDGIWCGILFCCIFQLKVEVEILKFLLHRR